MNKRMGYYPQTLNKNNMVNMVNDMNMNKFSNNLKKCQQ